MTYTVWALIFALGFGVGADPELVANLPALGLESLVIAVAATGGSIAAVVACRRFFSPGKKSES